VPDTLKHDLIIRLDEDNGKLIFFTARKEPTKKSSEALEQPFTIDIELADIKSRGVVGGERLIGASVLGFFDHLTKGRLKLPKNYRED
jgi:hypothetical protein